MAKHNHVDMPKGIHWAAGLKRAVVFIITGTVFLSIGIPLYAVFAQATYINTAGYFIGILLFVGTMLFLYGLLILIIALITKRRANKPAGHDID